LDFGEFSDKPILSDNIFRVKMGQNEEAHHAGDSNQPPKKLIEQANLGWNQQDNIRQSTCEGDPVMTP